SVWKGQALPIAIQRTHESNRRRLANALDRHASGRTTHPALLLLDNRCRTRLRCPIHGRAVEARTAYRFARQAELVRQSGGVHAALRPRLEPASTDRMRCTDRERCVGWSNPGGRTWLP